MRSNAIVKAEAVLLNPHILDIFDGINKPTCRLNGPLIRKIKLIMRKKKFLLCLKH